MSHQKMSGGLAMDPLDMVDVCPRCYRQRRPGDGNRLRINNGCCNSQHQWDRNQHHSPHRQAVTTVIDASGSLQEVRPLPGNALNFHGNFQRCHNAHPCPRPHCTYAHSDLELQAWNKRKKKILNHQQLPPSPPLIQPPKLGRGLSRTSSYVGGGLTKINHRRNYELLPEDKLNKSLLTEPLTRENYVDKFHTLLYYEEHEHARVLKERCDKPLKISLFTRNDEMYGSLVGLTSNDVVYIEQAATHVEIAASGTTISAEIANYGVSNKGLEVVNVRFNAEHSFHLLKSKITKQSPLPVHFILKHSYFRNLHKSLDKINSRIINCLIPDNLQPQQENLPRTPFPAEDFLWLDKEYQLLALKKMMACDNSAPFLLTGPFGTGKTRVLATAAITFLKRPANRVLICTSHLQSADAYIDNYFGPMADNRTLPRNVNPIRLVGDYCNYNGRYRFLLINGRNHQEVKKIKQSRLIITTFLTAPQLINLKVKRFTHILIDEGAQTREPETIAPLGLADDCTKIVIAGDHLQIGPQMLVLGDEEHKGQLGQSLLQRLHELYHEELPFDNPYTALLLTNYRCHDSILRLPSNLFFESTLQVRTQSKLHPKTPSALEFICTSMDSSVVVSTVDHSEEEAIITLEQVQRYVDPWPVAQWGEKDLSTICVMASSRNQVRVIRKLLNQSRFRNLKSVKTFGTDGQNRKKLLQTLATYELQGREFRAIFISTLEVTKEDGSTLNPTKTICDKYVFNTVITRSQSLIVCVGNPFLLFSIEKCTADSKKHEAPVYCWREYVKRCLETSSLQLASQCYETNESILQGNIAKLYEETFGDLQESLSSPCGNVQEVSDSILKAYKRAFQSNKAYQNVKVILGDIGNGDRGYVLQRGDSQTADKPVKDSSTVGAPVECYLESITFRKATATPLDPSQPPITINGVDNRRGALDGSLVKVALYEDADRCGQVIEVIEQGHQQQFVCSVDGHNSIFFCPIDRKSPKLVNLPGLSREMLKKASSDLIIKEELNYKQHAVTVFDPKSFTNPNKEGNGSIKFADVEVPQIKDVIPLSIAQKLLFVVSFLRWNPKYRYPLGVVIAAIPRGLTLYHAQRMLLAHHHINNASVEMASDDCDGSVMATNISSLPQYDHAMTIDPPEAKMLDDALTVEPLPSKDDQRYYQLGVHITNVGKALNRTTVTDKNARERGIAVYGSKTNPLFYPMLPKKIREDLSLDCGKKALALSITCRVSISGKNIEINDIKVHESCVRSRARLTYKDAQELLKGVKNNDNLDKIVSNYNETLPTDDTFRLEQRLAVLLQISEFFFRHRTQSNDVDYAIEDDEVLLNPQAYFLVREMMIWANRIAAEHVLATFPELTLLRRQKPPNQDRLTKAIEQYKDAVDFSPLYKSLAVKLDITTAPGSFLVTELLRKQLLGALQSGDIQQASNLLRVTSYHPQLAVLSREVNSSKSRAQYVCSGNFQEQVKLKLQRGDYLVSLTDAQKEVYGHYDQGCLYTHFTSPLRRYIDIVMQRLILQSLSSSATNRYSLQDLKKICDDSNAKVSAAKQFGKEFKRLCLTLSLAECSQPCTAYVASIDKSLQVVIGELDCQFLSQDQRSFRLSSVTSSAKRYANCPCPSGGITETENNFFAWKVKITSLMSSYMVNKFINVKKCSSTTKLTEKESDALFTFYLPELSDDSTSTERNPFSALTQQCYSAEFTDKPLPLSAEEWTKVTDFRKQPSVETATPLKKLLMSHNPTEDGGCVKFPTNASFWLYEVKQSFEAYKCFKVSLAASFSEYILSPCIQLLEVAPMLNVCVQHSTNPASCFSTPILSHASRIQYNDINEYIDLWEKVLLAEAAVQSISDDAEVQLIKNVPLKWPTLRQPNTSLDNIHYSITEQEHAGVTMTISDKFEERCGEYFGLQVGNLVCARYNIPLSEQKEVEGRAIETASAVYHFVIDGIDDPNNNDDDVTTKSTKKKSKKSEAKKQPNKIVHLKIVSKEAVRVSKFMKPYLEDPKSLCEIQIIPLNLPYRRMYGCLLALKRIAGNNLLCKQIALGTAFNSKISALSALRKTTLVRKDPSVFALWSGTRELNGNQRNSLLTAIRNKFQLIQGPPGTGKSVTGAHLAYAFIVAKNPDLRFVPSHSTDEKIKCVMYCGPSNKSVDVVLDMFLKHPNIKDLRILRIYSKSIETKYYYGPHSNKVYSKPSSDQNCKETHKKFALHEKIRSKDCSLSPTILEMGKKFKKYSEENKLPSPLEARSYSDTIKEAEREIIRAGNYHIVFCTCNEACSVRVVDNIEPTHLIIDEAAMATEPEAMIPIQLAEHVTLIGDHMQLQPVINHTPAKEKGLGYSLFQRYAVILERDINRTLPTDSMLMLTTQYRMHEKICEFPSEEFYEGRLEADSSVLQHFCSLERFWPMGPQWPIVFCDIVGKEEGPGSHHKAHQESKCNEIEALKIVDIIVALRKAKRSKKNEPKIAVLTPYKAQKRLVEELVEKKKLEVIVSTINESQGSEFDFVIFSTVRSMPRRTISNRAAVQPDRTWIRDHLGFITDRHQICVGITRAKHGMVIVGNAMLLGYDETWNRLLDYYRRNGCYKVGSTFPLQQR